MNARVETLNSKAKKSVGPSRMEQMRRDYERRLQTLERRLHHLIGLSSDYYWEMDAEHRFTHLQNAGVNATGADPAQLLGKARWELPYVTLVSHGGNWERHKADLDARQPFADLIYKYVTLHGELRYISTTGEPAFDDDGSFLGYRGISKDITRRVQTERRIAVEQAVHRILAEAHGATETAHEILQAICETLGWTCAARWTLDEETQTLACAETWSIPAAGVEEFLAVTRKQQVAVTDEGLVRRACASGKPLWIRNVTKEKSFLRAREAIAAKLRSAFAFPIKIGAKVIGVMEFYSQDMAHEADHNLLDSAAYLGSSIGQSFGRKRAEQELVRFRAAMDMSADEIYLTDPQRLRFLDVNETACRVTGYTREEMLKIGPAQLWAGKPDDFHRLFEDVIAHGPQGTLSEGIGTSKDGQRRCPVEARRRALWIDNHWIILTVTRDISERQRAEQAQRRLNHMYAALSATNEAILRAESAEDLYRRVCEAAVEGGRFHSASVVVPGAEGTSARTAATAGASTGWLHDTTLSFDGAIAEGRGLIGTAFRTQSVCVSNDYLTDERTQPWHAHACAAGVLSAAAAPLTHKGSPAGVLMFFSSEKNAFDEDVIKLIARMAENIAFALENFERERERRRSEDELKNFRSIMDIAPDSIFVVDPQAMRFVYFNEANLRMGGWGREEFERLTPTQASGVPEEELKRLYADVIAKNGEPLTREMTYKAKSGMSGWFETQRRAVKLDGRWVILTISREITTRKLAEKKAEWQSRMYAALSATNEAIMQTHSTEELYRHVCNAAVNGGRFHTTAVLLPAPDGNGMRVAAAIDNNADILRDVHLSIDESRPEGQGLVGTAFRTGQPVVSNDFMKDERMRPWHAAAEQAGIKSGAAVPLLRAGCTIGVLLLYSGSKRAFGDEAVKLLERMAENIVFALDNFKHEAERKRAEERIQYLATHDGLTGLPNRVMFSQLLTTAIQSSRRYNRKFALFFIDLDRFKTINDTLGHESGDQLLQEVSQRLRECLRASDTVARLGGDEFVVLVQEATNAEQTSAVARKILSAVMRPLVLAGHECRVTASIGIAMYPGDGEDEQSLMKNADIAMYHAKGEGKNNFQVHSAKLTSQSLERLTLESNLRRALERDELSLNYQAKLDLKTNRITGVEALLRWNSRELGSVSPAQFIPIAEETGMIVPIGKWVLRTACMQNVDWQRQGLPPVCMAVNLSARQFSDENLLADIRAALDESGMDPTLLEIEITEGMVITNPERAVEILTAIKRMGVRLAIDDFGTGYSSLGQLKNFPIDTLKVDRSFIREIPDDSEDKAITEAIIAMGKTLSLTVVAEGVETEAQAQFLREHSCDEMQGYYFSKPITPEDFAALLRNHTRENATR